MDPKNPGLLAYLHPAVATATLLFAFWVLRQGLAQRRLRLRRVPVALGNLKRHTALGPWAVALFTTSLLLGLGTAILLRGWTPLGTWHGRLGVLTTGLFLTVWLLGRRLLDNHKHLAGTHGVLALVALFLGSLVGLLGISLLP